ncbi:tRNA (adenosine(37)-N6)-dimethylallyltransferase MiaA [Candidatus Wirthbacteria bacterium CG2_30_54_11]|uniref:tRNA dimethylallyltransferase n=1 Tax=Candidatus Wirthbacteria bacterium CG2_30_54_11 TaxID=1817892 RepID=A0A1J5J605_9BACT|nr:MAG: tRNA (adenosine(37)-N6)-dimethylallyltransferase MiaA [Candidatus Wirthbacteria bacterium CG2_30_54_11]
MSSPQPRHQVLVVTGPTGTGKTELALKAAQTFGGEIICADSRTVYRGMDIGTAKVAGQTSRIDSGDPCTSFRTGEGIPHYLVDVVEPNQEFSVAQFQKLASDRIDELFKKKKLPILAGGTGLYIKSMVDGLDFPDTKTGGNLRAKLEKLPLLTLITELERLDPDALALVDLKNPRRVLRAVEICLLTGVPFSRQQTKHEPKWDILQVALTCPREVLYQRLDARVDAMMRSGLLEEVRSLSELFGYDASAMTGIGYKQLGAHLRGELSLTESVELIKRDTRRYAKRQMTWFRRDERIQWVENAKSALGLIRAWYSEKG